MEVKEVNFWIHETVAMIYLAGPYAHATKEGREVNFRMHEAVAVKMLRAGFHPYSPIVHWHAAAEVYELPIQSSFWCGHNRVMIAHSTEVWVLPGWENSEGTKTEIDAARQYKIPVRFLERGDDGVIVI